MSTRRSQRPTIFSKEQFNDNGTIQTVKPGDVTFTGAGEGHGLEAVGEEPLEVIALILFQ